MKPILIFAALLGLVPAAAGAQSAQPAYGAQPAQGQPAVGQASNQMTCQAWATQQTGYDPSRPPPPQATATPQATGSRARGAAAGAMIGGASAGEAGTGAAAGAVAGGVANRSRARQSARAQNNATAQQQQAGQAAYNQALSTCLASKGSAPK
jgi:hypothetical protein